MYKVIIERECGCVRRANMSPEYSYDDKDLALIEAGELARKMNDDFCGKHQFAVRQEGENFLITMQMRG
ncbi:hypothetical protein [Sulfurimonas sp. HSL3-7]|uniref:hypothetical protein n=1 Tax=Sulfonitrofixus jiaomeiensis TaxID=3131938 RepID=UPI0031F95731